MATSGSSIGAGLGAAAGWYFGGPAGGAVGANIGSSFGGMFDEPGGEHPTGKPLAIYDQMYQNYVWQKEFAQNGIQWRVEDAKNAGLHPLYALGGGGAAFAPSGVAVDGPPSYVGTDHGQNLASALARVETAEQRNARELGLAEIKSRIGENDARAAYYDAMAMKAYQEALGQPGMPSPPTLLGGQSGVGGDGITIPARLQFAPGNTDAIRLKANEVVSSVEGHPWRAPGTKPMWERADFGVLGKWFVPRTDDFWETWGELSWYDKLVILGASIAQEKASSMPRPVIPNNAWEVFDLGDDFYSRGEYVSPRRLKPQLSNQKFFYGR